MKSLLRLGPRTTLILMLVSLAGCLSDADHLNPLDPLAPDFVDEGRIEGRITNRSLSAIEGATVVVAPGGMSAITSADGSFVIDGVPAGQYVVTAGSSEYQIAADTVEVSFESPSRADFELNGLPSFEGWTVNTAHISRWFPLEDLFQMELAVQASDTDGVFDLDKVWLEIPSLQFSDTLQVTPTPGLFLRTLNATDLPSGTIHALLGSPLQLHVRDQPQAVVTSPTLQLVRVIDVTPEATDEAFQFGTPNCLQVQSGNTAAPPVEWEEVFLPFPFEHQVEVIRVDPGVETLVERITDISSDSTAVGVGAVPPGDYYWTVAVVDDFNNRSRSKQVGFCVQ
ncbi:MAG: carboxypeptidase-like regulatory domain-containing protein [Rhodothermales bacterium]|nr:carboxypeptidase-like regulatory domain-containing protein [Rhodothermales bacterium]